MKYLELLSANKGLKAEFTSEPYKIKVLSNITINQIKEVLEYSIRVHDINCDVSIGDYDNIVQNSCDSDDVDAVIIFFELCNIIDGLQYKIDLFDASQLDDFVNTTKSTIRHILDNLSGAKLVLFNNFTSFYFSSKYSQNNKLDYLASELNGYLETIVPRNTKIINLDKINYSLGNKSSINLMYYSVSKALYTVNFFKSYADFVRPFILSANGKSKKIIVFDCDNTLWKGILGEDGFDGIDMSLESQSGAIYLEIQLIALSLKKKGILLALCSKNNADDVDEVLNSHPDMKLQDGDIAIKRVNWESKAENLISMASELNIGLDSFVFVDDSSFEVDLIRSQLPEVTTLQVPKKLHEYPQLLRDNLSLFYNLSSTEEDGEKTVMYQQQKERSLAQKNFADIDTYLSSLELNITLYEDELSLLARIAQLTQKTNQFNFTTKRYTEANICDFIESNFSTVFAFSVTDKFGDNGITGVLIVDFNEDRDIATIDTFLMSCRIIGRNIEHVFFNYVVNYLKDKSVRKIKAIYTKTKKNSQIESFYIDKGFSHQFDQLNSSTLYEIDIKDFIPSNIEYIKINEA